MGLMIGGDNKDNYEDEQTGVICSKYSAIQNFCGFFLGNVS